MTLAIEWTRDAQRDFGKIDDHYANLAPDFALKIGLIAIKSARRLAEFPAIGAPVAGFIGVRKWRVGKSDFLLFYRILPDRIQILRVRHMAEDWKSEFT
jgi:toxin ParE1/3/4